MLESLLSLLISEVPIKHIPGKFCKLLSFGNLDSPALAVIVFLGFATCGFCGSSVPLGFEISGSDRGVKNLVSENGVFEFGYFEKNFGGDANLDGLFVVGIRYKNLGSRAANVPVWTVGGGVRVSMDSTFKFSMDGKLILLENSGNSIVWSSNTSGLGVQTATLLDNGNLVLMGSGNVVVWESFNHPTNTLLPGQSLHFPQNLRAASTKSTTSYYSFVIRRSGELALTWENNVTFWRSQSTFSSADVKEARFDSSGVLGVYDNSNKSIWSVSSRDFDDPSVNLRHLRIDQDGNLRMYSWDNTARSWRIGWQAVENQCNVFGSCGLYSLCKYNSTGPICGCLSSDSLEWGSTGGTGSSVADSGGSECKKVVDLGSCKMHTSMSILKQTVLYGLYPPHDVDMMLSEEACKDYCSNDTSCLAVTSKNDGSGVCTIKRTAFISGYTMPSVASTSFLKVCLVPQAVAARGANPNANADLLAFSVGARGSFGSRKVLKAIAIVALVTMSIIFTLQVFIFWFIYHRRQIQTRTPFGKGAKTKFPYYSTLVRFSSEEIEEFTSSFSIPLGPSVYKGLLPTKTPVVAKLINQSVVPEKEFLKAVYTLGGIHHRNLVSLKGFCFEPKQKLLVYEYISNGSLDKWLFGKERIWEQRLDIAIGVARALAYLHTECQQCIVHGNVKLENVLLDENLVPKLTDFGIRTFLQTEVSSSSGSPSEQDIYMLGKMLLEIVLCERDITADSLDQVFGRLNQEQKYLDSEDLRGVERVVRIALWCTQTQTFLRPSIGEVVKVLEGTLSVDRPPSTTLQGNVAAEIEVES